MTPLVTSELPSVSSTHAQTPEHAPVLARVEEALGREQVPVVDPAPVPDVVATALALLHRRERVGAVVVPPDGVVVLVGFTLSGLI
jgi:hypothetical protein